MLSFDFWVFGVINGFHSPFFDRVMSLVSGQLIWIPYFILTVYLFLSKDKGWKLGLLAVVFLACAVGLADFTSVHIFKNNFERLRPCHNPLLESTVHLVDGHCGGAYGFVSSHSANFFALFAFASLFIRERWFAVVSFVIAATVGYSRIYLGVHFPLDVICGALWGVITGGLLYYIFKQMIYAVNNFNIRNKGNDRRSDA